MAKHKLFILANICILLCLFHKLFAQQLSSSNLPIIVIETNGQTIQDEPKITVDMGVIWNGPGEENNISDPFNDYDGVVGIEIRGASSQDLFPKKQYAIETRDSLGNNLNVSLLGMPAENDWILHAPYSDKTLMRNVLIYKLSNDLNQYASRTRYCELVLNNSYMGVYILMEKIKRDDNRVNLSELDVNDLAGDSLTGGYIIKIDKNVGTDTDGWASDFPPFPGSWQSIYYQYHYPNENNIQTEQADYIEDFMYDFESLMDEDDYNDPDDGYYNMIDTESFIDYIILNELSKNVDAYKYSTFFHKDRDSNGGLLRAGPVWDFNITLGNVDYFDGFSSEDWIIMNPPSYYNIKPFWWIQLMDDPYFYQQMKYRWNSIRKTSFHLDTIFNFIDNTAEFINEAQERNYLIWPILGEYVWPNYYVGETYEDEVDYLKEFITDRIDWMDQELVMQPLFSEINYNSSSDINAGDWIEIYNPTIEDIDISGWEIRNDQMYFFVFPEESIILAESSIVVCEDMDQFQTIYSGIENCLGDLLNELNIEETTLMLYNSSNELIDELSFTNTYPWPIYSDETGYSIELKNIFIDNSLPENWCSSAYPGGSPGEYNPPPPVFINEFMAENQNTITDEAGAYDDWIELYNASEIPVNVGGMYISDNYGDYSPFEIPNNDSTSTTIQPGGFLLLWADNDPDEGSQHLGFNLNKNLEQIILYSHDRLSIADSISFGSQAEDISFGRVEDGDSSWVFFENPTPNASNNLLTKTETLLSNKINVYPNPSSGNFSIVLPNNHSLQNDYIIYDLYGIIKKYGIIKNSHNDINVEGFSSGLYVLIVNFETYKVLKKLTIIN